MKRYNVAVVGVGAVGEEMLRILRERRFPIAKLRVFARRSRNILVDRRTYSVEKISPQGFDGIDIALFAGTEGEKGAAVTYAPGAIARGAIVIDNGADFRLDPKVPLVVPEVNASDLKVHRGLIANPNCSTIQLVVAIWPIYKKVGIRRLIVASYQAASGAGRGAVRQLEEEVKGWCQGIRRAKSKVQVLPQRVAFNIFPHIGNFREFDYTTEEWKTVEETRKIMHARSIKISATCVRVPVKVGHGEAIYIETKGHIEPNDVRKLLARAPGIKVVDSPRRGLYPMPIDAAGQDEVFVGRIRKDPFLKNGLWLWVVSDNLRKGAALNAIQIAEELIKGGKI